MVQRRQFVIAALAGACAWSGRAQAAATARIGILAPFAPADGRDWAQGLAAELRPFGYVEGRNLAFEARWSDGRIDGLPALAAELVGLKPDLIVSVQTPTAVALKQATRTIPVIMAPVADPVGNGLIASLARPGGNITGMSGAVQEIGAKALELIRELVPGVRRVGLVVSTADAFTPTFLKRVQEAGDNLGLTLTVHSVRAGPELDAAFEALAKARVGAVMAQPSLPHKQVIELAQKHRLPTISPSQVFAHIGGLLSYSGSRAEVFRQTASYVDRILKGAKPADLPVQQPTLFEIVVNQKMARQIGFTVPPALLGRADRVIE
jgi:putative ABC transport system substrate-binding protein